MKALLSTQIFAASTFAIFMPSVLSYLLNFSFRVFHEITFLNIVCKSLVNKFIVTGLVL